MISAFFVVICGYRRYASWQFAQFTAYGYGLGRFHWVDCFLHPCDVSADEFRSHQNCIVLQFATVFCLVIF